MKIKQLNLLVGSKSKKAKVIFREAVIEDVPQIMAISKNIDSFRMSEFTSGVDKKELAFWISSQNAIVVTANIESELIGYGYGFCLSPKWFLFDAFTVISAFRGMGIGRKMYAFLRDECQSKGFDLIQGLVKDKQASSLNYWTKLGFEEGSKCIWVEDWLDED